MNEKGDLKKINYSDSSLSNYNWFPEIFIVDPGFCARSTATQTIFHSHSIKRNIPRSSAKHTDIRNYENTSVQSHTQNESPGL